MTVSLVTLFPDLYNSFLSTSIVGRAQEQQAVSIEKVCLFDYAAPKERIDAPTFGHGAGMLLRPDVIERAIQDRESKQGNAFKIFFSPQGEKLDADLLKEIYVRWREKKHLMLLPARYEGMDARVEHYYADKIVSVGDFVLMGGDLPAMMLLEGLLRLVPGVIGKQESVNHDSFAGAFIDHPEFTVPVVWNDLAVPEVVRSGNHKQIAQWRQEAAVSKSTIEHFEWVRSHALTAEEERLVGNYIPHHYAILMHTQVVLPNDQEGCTSVTSLDIHDIARSACTYGLKGYFIVTPLADQQKIIRKLLDFWASQEGEEYNSHRHRALEHVVIVSSLEQALIEIEKEGSLQLLYLLVRPREHQNMCTISNE